MVLWPLFGSLNQLMAALALGVVTVYLSARRISIWYTLFPMLIILVLTLWAMGENLAGFVVQREWLLVIISALILILTAWLTLSSVSALIRRSSSTANT